jgi:predicted phage tail protein
MMRKVFLHGNLGRKFGKLHILDVETAGEAVRALLMQHDTMGDFVKKGRWHVVRAKRGCAHSQGYDLDLEMVSSYRLGSGDLHIMPAIGGSKRGGLLKVILGVALVGAAFAFSLGSGVGLMSPIASTGVLHSVTWGNVAMVGVALAASGASQLLAPEEETEKDDSSFLMGGPTNTYAEGAAVPLVYGEVITGGVIISAGSDVEQLKTDDTGDGEKSNEERAQEDDDRDNPIFQEHDT